MSGPITLPTTVRKLGPGAFTVGAAGTLQTLSCLINGLTLTPSKDSDDPVVKLCGTTRPGEVRYTWTLDGNIDLDVADDAGFFALSVTAPGSQQAFSFTPVNDGGPVVTGTLILDPLPLGGDEAGKLMSQDFSFDLVGDPTFTWDGGI